jgi:hypothetical protein
MKSAASRLAWLLPLVLCACAHTPPQTQIQAMAPPIEEAPPPPDIAPGTLPQTALEVPKTRQPVAVPPEPVKTPTKHRKPAVKTAPQVPAAPAPTQNAEAAPPAEENALGKFETPEAPDRKKETEASIAEIERGLNTLGRQLNSTESKTSTQIREFLKQARQALSTGDIDGASTLTKKAKTLLGELSQ